MIHPLQEAFDKLTAELDRIYGAAHTHDFQEHLDAVEAEIKKVVDDNSAKSDATQ